MVGGWRGGREEFCCGVFNCLVGLPWAVLTPKQELSVLIFFFFLPSWLSLWSNCPVLFCYWPQGPDWSRERWRRKGGQRLPSEGLPNPPKALLERLPRPPKELERLKGSAKCQTGISKKGGGGGWLAVLTPTPTHYTLLFSYKRAVVVLALPP